MPRRTQIERYGTSIEEFQGRYHRHKYPEEQGGDFDNRRKMEMVFAMDRSRRRIPRKSGHRDHDRLLNSSRPAKMSAENGRGYDSEQVKKIALALNLKRVPGLYDLGHHTMGFDLLFRENELIVNIE